jgi:hypothetical protein
MDRTCEDSPNCVTNAEPVQCLKKRNGGRAQVRLMGHTGWPKDNMRKIAHHTVTNRQTM